MLAEKPPNVGEPCDSVLLFCLSFGLTLAGRIARIPGRLQLVHLKEKNSTNACPVHAFGAARGRIRPETRFCPSASRENPRAGSSLCTYDGTNTHDRREPPSVSPSWPVRYPIDAGFPNSTRLEE